MYCFSRVSRIAQGLCLALGAGAMLPGCSIAGAQQFLQPKVIATGNWPVFVTTDGGLGATPPNLIYIDQGATPAASVTHVLLNDGKGNFTLGQALATGGSVLAVGDFDGDGFNDLGWVTCTTVCSGYYAPGRGDGTYGAAVLLGTLTSGAKLPVAAYLSSAGMHRDAPTRGDLVVADSANNQIYVLSVEAKGASVAGTPVAGGVGQIDYEASDYDGDGNDDLIFPGSVSGLETMLLGNGDGTFKTPVTFPSLGQILHSKVLPGSTEVNAPLQLYCEGPSGRIDVYEIQRNGTISATSIGSTGKQDARSGTGGQVVVRLVGGTESYIYATNPLGMSVLTAGPDGAYRLQAIYNVGPRRGSPVLGSFNLGNELDFAMDSPEGIAIVSANEDGTLQTSLGFAAGQPAYSMTLGKFTGSGALDAVVATGTPQVQWMQGDGKGNFVAAAGGPSPAGSAQTNAGRTVWSHVVAGDFDGDGKLDAGVSLDGPVEKDLGVCIVCQPTDNGMIVMFGDGAGNFGTPVAEGPPQSGAHYGMLAAADVNGDGISDLINYDDLDAAGYDGAAGFRQGLPMINLFGYWNDGYLRPYQLVATGYLKAGRTSAPDIAVESLGGSLAVNAGNSLSFSVEKNDGTGTYSDGQQTFATPPLVAEMTPGSSALPKTGLYPSAMLLSDVDGDGNGDLMVMYHNLAADPANPSAATQNQVYIFWGNGDGSFEPTPEILTLSRNYYQMAVADVDGDGKQDLVMSDGYLVSVLAGNGTRIGFGRETHYLAGMGINQIAVADVNGDGKMDIVVANGGAVLSAGVVNNGVLAANAEVNTGGLTVLSSGAATPPPALSTLSGAVTASPEPSVYGAPFTLTATFAPPSGGAAPGGSVTFSIDGTVVGTESVTNNAASLVINAATITAPLTNPYTNTIYWDGTHTLSADYSGDASYSSETLHGSHTVIGQPTISTLTDLDQNIFYGQEIGYDNGVNALVGATAADPSTAVGTLDGGNLVVYIDGNLVCTLAYGNPAACPDPPFEGFQVGQHTTYVSYAGNMYYASSNSAIYTVTIAPDPTTATVTSSVNPSTFGQSVTFTATIGDLYTVAQGTVNFFDGTTMIGSGTVNGQGIATFSTSALSIGNHPINVVYVPKSIDFLTSSGALPLPMGQEVDAVPPPPPPPPPGPVTFTLGVNPTAISVGVGNMVTVQVTVTAMNGFSQPVQLGCSGLPHETTCTFAQSLIGPGGGTTALIVSPAAPHNCGSSTPDFIAPNVKAGLAGLMLSMLTLFGVRRRRRIVKALALMLMLSVLPMLNGCGSGCKDFGTEPTNYSFTVTAASTGTPVTALTQAVTMKVHL